MQEGLAAYIAFLRRVAIEQAVYAGEEGIAITREGAATIAWLVSDDNLFVLQRTLLFKFRLDLPETPPARSPNGERAGE